MLPPSTKLKRLFAGLLTVTLMLIGLPTTLKMDSALAETVPNSSGFGPQRYHDGLQYGTGVYFAPYHFTVYSQPDEQSPILADYRWSRRSSINDIAYTTPTGGQQMTTAENVFICFYPGLDVAILPVLSDNGQGWVEVLYSQTGKKSGWVRLKAAPSADSQSSSTKTDTEIAHNVTTASTEPTHFGAYQTWLEFMRLNARVNGIYWLSGVSAYNRSLRTKNEDTATLLQVTIMRSLKVRFVRGNWLLVEALDFEHNTPIGWVRWRDDDGNLMVFPNISGQRTPIVTTSQ